GVCSVRQRNCPREFDLTLQPRAFHRPAEVATRASEDPAPADDHVRKRAPEGLAGEWAPACARTCRIAELLVHDNRAASDCDRADVACPTTSRAERNRLGRVTVWKEITVPAEPAIWKFKGRTAAVDILEYRLSESHAGRNCRRR